MSDISGKILTYLGHHGKKNAVLFPISQIPDFQCLINSSENLDRGKNDSF
jgi:hypothetical protein